MAANGRRKAVSSAAGIKGVQPEPAQPSSRGLPGGVVDGGMATPLDSTRAGTLGALGAAAGGVAAAGSLGQQAASQPSRSAAAEGWQQAEETGKLLAAGGVAGAVSKSATAPLARLTILYQVQGFAASGLGSPPGAVQPPSLRQAFAAIVRSEGLAALWKGNGATIVHRLPYSAINFWAFERLTELWNTAMPPQQRGHSHSMDVARRLVAGGAAGMCACTVGITGWHRGQSQHLVRRLQAYPLDLLRTRLAAQTTSSYYSGITRSLATIVRDEGFGGLYRGLGATLIQVGPSLAINYCAYETSRSVWLSHSDLQSPTVVMSLLCGSFAGLVSSTATFPLDLARRRMQLQGQHGTCDKRCSYPEVFRQIYAQRGLPGLYAGIIPEYAKVVPGVAIAFCSYELMKKMLGVQTNITNR